MQPEELLLELVHALHRRMLECVQPVAQEHGLSRMAMLVLRLIQTAPGETVSDLARRAEIAKSHISNSVELLAQRDFVERRPDAEDRRLVRLFPTTRANAVGQQILEEARLSISAALREVDPATVDALVETLQTVLAAFERNQSGTAAGSPRSPVFPPRD